MLKRKEVLLVESVSQWQSVTKRALRLIDDPSSSSSGAKEDMSYVAAGN
jgi:hypothetical protein